MRITTNMIRDGYTNSLQSSLGGLNDARYQVETGRRFQHSYQDPAAAAKGSILENRFARNKDYIEATENTMKWQDTQEDVLSQLNDIATEVDKKYSVEAVSDTNQENRSLYATQLREMQKSMVNILNSKYGNTYVMAGNDAINAPFELTDSGTLTYRGVDVDSTDPADQAVLTELAQETAYVDLGFGMVIENGEIVPSTAFNSAVPGISVVGHGVDANGNSNNLITLMGDMADILDQESFNRGEFEELWGKFNEAAGVIRSELTEIGTKTQLLEATVERLEYEETNLYEAFEQTVNIDEAEAITNFTYANYIYSASLKIGNNILTQSLLDFLQ